jgi:hypothetical protein
MLSNNGFKHVQKGVYLLYLRLCTIKYRCIPYNGCRWTLDTMADHVASM